MYKRKKKRKETLLHLSDDAVSCGWTHRTERQDPSSTAIPRILDGQLIRDFGWMRGEGGLVQRNPGSVGGVL